MHFIYSFNTLEKQFLCVRQQDALSCSAIRQERDAFLLVIHLPFLQIFTRASLMPAPVHWRQSNKKVPALMELTFW